jgi:hypothetical protein
MPTSNVIMQDIENNRLLLDNSVKAKMVNDTYKSYFKGVAGIVRSKADVNSRVDLAFSKYDQYYINKEYEIITKEVLPTDITNIRFDDIEPELINSISGATGNYTVDDSGMVIYTDLINTTSLPKFKAIYNNIDSEDRYYIFDTIRGSIPEYEGVGETSDDATLCLLDVYTKNKIIVKTSKGSSYHTIKYDISTDEDHIFRTIDVDEETYYVKLANDENDLSGYIIIPSTTADATYEDAESLINDFPFEDIGLTVEEDDVYPLSYISDGLGNSSVGT